MLQVNRTSYKTTVRSVGWPKDIEVEDGGGKLQALRFCAKGSSGCLFSTARLPCWLEKEQWPKV